MGRPIGAPSYVASEQANVFQRMAALPVLNRAIEGERGDDEKKADRKNDTNPNPGWFSTLHSRPGGNEVVAPSYAHYCRRLVALRDSKIA